MIQPYYDFLRDRIKILSDEISGSVTSEEIDIHAIANMSREIYSYCKVIDHLEKEQSYATPTHK